MKQVTLVGLLLLVSSAVPVYGQQQMEYSIAPWYGFNFGDTRFELDFGTGGSELVFPLDAGHAGIEFGFRTIQNGHTLWTGNLRLGLNMGDPSSKMTDRDWVNTPYGVMEFSSTESVVDGSVVDLEIEGTRLLTHGAKTELAVIVGVVYQKIKQRMITLKGWQKDLDAPYPYPIYTIDAEILGLTYEARYVRPQIGLMPRFLFGDVTLELKGVISPLLFVKDIDDHVLRGFQVRTDGKGFGFGGRLALAYRAKGGIARGWFGRLAVELSRANVKVKGFRKYYRDNPDDDAQAGSRFAVEHKVSSTQYGVRLQAGFWF